MDPITLTVAFKGLGMLMVIAGGIWIARYGYHLYRDGAGHGRDQAAFEFGKLKIKAHSVGSVVMSTAFLWAFAGVLLSPNMERKGNDIRIYSMSTPTGELEALALTTKSAVPPSLKSDPEKLKALLGEAASDTTRKGAPPLARLDGKPASIDMASIKAIPSNNGDLQLWTQITTGDKTASLRYQAVLSKDTVTFVPAGSGQIDPKL